MADINPVGTLFKMDLARVKDYFSHAAFLTGV